MIPKYPSERGKRDKAGETIGVQQALDFCHADIVTEFRSSAIGIFSSVFQGICALNGEIHPLKAAKNLYSFSAQRDRECAQACLGFYLRIAVAKSIAQESRNEELLDRCFIGQIG